MSDPADTKRLSLSRASLLRLIRDLLAAELGRSRGRSAAMLGVADWREETCLGQEGLDLDSLERLNASAALSEFFHLHDYGAEDYLLTLPLLGDWCDLVAQSLAVGGSSLTFRTSGSTGTPKPCAHAVADLLDEVEAWVRILGPVRRIVSLVPSHHIYGALFTALLPDRLGAEVIRVHTGSALLQLDGADTLVVATPTLWEQVAHVCPALPAGLTGLSSTASMPPALAEQLAAKGLDRLIEIYGSSETGGVGYRTAPTNPFRLLDCWTHVGGDEVARAGWSAEARHRLMDHSHWIDARRFRIDRRHDGAVQVGGVNVFPALVRAALIEHHEIADAAVRLNPSTGRLKAFIVPVAGDADDALIGRVDGWCGRRLRGVERPRQFAFGPQLPRDAIGKLADW